MYNPYDLVSMTINGQEIFGRPIAFDSDVVNNDDMTNAAGNYVVPTRLSSCCQDCGQGIEVDVYFEQPPFDVVVCECENCHPEPSDIIDPFMNPISEERIGEHELDPHMQDPNAEIDETESSVADRMGIPDEVFGDAGVADTSDVVDDTDVADDVADTSDDADDTSDDTSDDTDDTDDTSDDADDTSEKDEVVKQLQEKESDLSKLLEELDEE